MSLDTGLSDTMFTVPVTRGSRMKKRPVCWLIVLITDWMSALTKLTVIFSSPLEGVRLEEAGAEAGAWAKAPGTASASAAARSRGAGSRRLRNLVT